MELLNPRKLERYAARVVRDVKMMLGYFCSWSV
jgi:hypothetical protein